MYYCVLPFPVVLLALRRKFSKSNATFLYGIQFYLINFPLLFWWMGKSGLVSKWHLNTYLNYKSYTLYQISTYITGQFKGWGRFSRAKYSCQVLREVYALIWECEYENITCAFWCCWVIHFTLKWTKSASQCSFCQ